MYCSHVLDDDTSADSNNSNLKAWFESYSTDENNSTSSSAAAVVADADAAAAAAASAGLQDGAKVNDNEDATRKSYARDARGKNYMDRLATIAEAAVEHTCSYLGVASQWSQGAGNGSGRTTSSRSSGLGTLGAKSFRLYGTEGSMDLITKACHTLLEAAAASSQSAAEGVPGGNRFESFATGP